MGVLGLWQLLQPSSRPTKLQALEGKRLAIDISIWLHQATKGVRNSSNGHLSVLYNRICKLLYFKVKPIFVFDGPNVPKLKERILRERQRRRNEAAEKSSEIQNRIEKNILESYALKNVLLSSNNNDIPNEPEAVKKITSSNSIHAASNIDDDLFKLPSEEPKFIRQVDCEVITDETNTNALPVDIKNVFLAMQNIDQEVFESLPADIQIELLTTYKEALKSKKSEKFEEFPEESMDFSKFQLKSLLHKSDVSNRINTLKNTIKSNILMDSGFENVFQQKVASEDDREVILFTRKNSKTSFKNSFDTILGKKKYDDEEEFENDNNNGIRFKKQTSKTSFVEEGNQSPKYSIDFDENNKLKLIPTQTKINENKDEVYIKNFNDVDEIEEIKINIPSKVVSSNSIHNAEKFVENLTGEKELILVDESKKPEALDNYENDVNLDTQLKKSDDSDSDDDSDFVEVDLKDREKVEDENFLIEQVNREIIKSQSKNEIELIDLDLEENISLNTPDVIDLEKENEGDNNVQIGMQKNNQKEKHDNEVRPSTSLQANQDLDMDYFNEYNEFLLRENKELMRDKQNLQRLSNSIEQSIIDEAKYLLRLFGLPYVESPGEAEAQCAYLDYTNQIDGSITEDSDVWLFGANRVYKNFFGQEATIDSYDRNVIKSQLGFDRDTLICVAMLVGSDYTEGIENVGIVKAIEILQEFEGDGIEKLKNFKKWSESTSKDKAFNKVRKSLLKLKLPDSFPSEIVYNAYINPDVDKSTDEFKWSMPELDLIRKYLTKKMSWTSKKIDDDLLPVIKRLNETKVQKTIETFFTYETKSSFSKQSKRMINAINMFKNKNNNETDSNTQSSSNDFNLSENEDDENDIDNSNSAKQVSQVTKKQSKPRTTRNTKSKSKSSKKTSNKIDDEIIIVENDVDDNEKISPSKKRKSSESSLSNIQITDTTKSKRKITKRK